MTKTIVPIIAFVACLSTPAFAEEKVDLKDAKKKSSYAIGIDIASNLKRQDLDLDGAALAAGLADAFAGKAQLKDEEVKQVLTEFRSQLMSQAEARQKVAGEKNLKAGEDFLATNKAKDGVKSTESGLQYKVIKSGNGKAPSKSDSVKVHYHGTLIDGTVFDSSVDRGEPVTFGVGDVIPGWTEALQLMKEGDKWQLFIPAKLAYGEKGPSPKIGPNSVLIFDVELLSIEKN